MLGERRVWAHLSIENVEPFAALVVSLRSDHPMLQYVSWHPNPVYPPTTMCAEVMRDGQKQVFIGIMGPGKSVGPLIDFGKVEFAIQGDGPLTLTESDLEFLVADLLVVGGEVRAFSTLRLEKAQAEPTYRDELAQNFPNPFNPTTTIAFSLENSSDVSLAIFDVRGSHVRTLVDGRREAGVHRTRWDGMDQRGVQVSSGVYFYRLIADSFRDTKKMVLLR